MKESLKKNVFDKQSFTSNVDISIKELNQVEQINSFFDINLATIDDFFILYNKFFYDIPQEGGNSHTTLVEKSGEYINYDNTNETIVALTEEITELRQENLDLLQNKLDIPTNEL
jgi:hypothetical protein